MTTFATLTGVAFHPIFDTQGNLFIANYAIQGQFGTTLSKITPDGSVSVFALGLNGPNDLAFDASGLLYVTEWTGSIKVVAPDGTVSSLATGSNILSGLAFDATGNLYASETGATPSRGRILKFTLSSPGVVSGVSTFAENNGLDRPASLAFDQDGNLCVANTDGGNDGISYTILRITPNGTISTFLTTHDYPEDIVISPAPSALISGQITLQNAVAQAQPVTFEFRPINGSTGFSRTMTLNTDGTFSLAHIPRKAYSIRVKGAKWLAKAVAIDTTNGEVSNVNATLRGGDANNDNAVDIQDLLVLIGAYNKLAANNDGYLEAADFNGDGANDITDLLLLIGNYNQIGD